MITPEATLYLLENVDLINDEHTIDFENETTQRNYFLSKKAQTLVNTKDNKDFKYIRENEALNVAFNIETLTNINYVMYQNQNKWYYAKVLNKSYVNEETTKLHLKLDLLQTFMFDYELQESFIEREHQNRFNTELEPIYNEEPENLEIGNEYKILSGYMREPNNTPANLVNGFYLIKAKEPLATNLYYNGVLQQWETTDPSITENSGINTGVYTYVIVAGISGTLGTGLSEHLSNGQIRSTYNFSLNENIYLGSTVLFEQLQKDPNVLSIQFIRYLDDTNNFIKYGENGLSINFVAGGICKFVVTEDNKFLGMSTKVPVGEYLGFYIRNYSGNGFVLSYEDKMTPTLSIDNTPNIEYETKLKTYPYSYLNVNVYNEQFSFKREHFYNKNKYEFELHTSMGAQNNLVFVPKGYNWGTNNSHIFNKKTLQVKNELTLRTDKWLDYIYNNKASLNGGLAVAGSQLIANIGLGFATGGIGLAVAGSQALSFAGQVANEMLKRQDIKEAPDDVRVVSDDIGVNSEIQSILYSFGVYPMEIQETFKNKIFKYFQHYGYKVNDFKKPNIKSRYYYNYIKTIDANIKSNINQEYIEEIASLYNKGITFWHYRDANTFKGIKNYDYENVEINLIEEIANG